MQHVVYMMVILKKVINLQELLIFVLTIHVIHKEIYPCPYPTTASANHTVMNMSLCSLMYMYNVHRGQNHMLNGGAEYANEYHATVVHAC